LDNRLFRSAIFGEETESIIQSRRLLLRGLTSYKQHRKITELTNFKRKSNRVLVNFLEQFWECFFKRLWKFRCEIMIDWEKKNNISARLKKTKKKRKKPNLNKENTKPVDLEKETRKEKYINVQTEACKKIDYWVIFGTKDEWLKFKTN